MCCVANVALLASAAPFRAPFPSHTTSCGTAQIEPGVDVPYVCCPPKLDIDPSEVPYCKFPPVTKPRIC
ncbi:Polyphenol oxidase F, chloroplastic [Capsicum baccatum]|uniref:Polyphenol oxidase F, chloroplastic n=1 Tax=Capsicum baccatum TaxID=33114 RepID=A0A2G2XM27_CAPBA|nr:Polyphenol oxidase F, chloroplastic [Capsicum baccatum]